MKHPYKSTKLNGRRIDVHRKIMEQHLGRRLQRLEFVHHINGDKQDNRLENLQLMSSAEHNHHHQQKYPLTKTCVICSANYTPRATKRKISQTCSPECKRKLLSKRNRRPDAPNSMYRDGAYPCWAKNRIEL